MSGEVRKLVDKLTKYNKSSTPPLLLVVSVAWFVVSLYLKVSLLHDREGHRDGIIVRYIDFGGDNVFACL